MQREIERLVQGAQRTPVQRSSIMQPSSASNLRQSLYSTVAPFSPVTDKAHLAAQTAFAQPAAAAVASMKDVFRQKCCNQRMVREYFLLLGRMTNYDEGVKLIDASMIFQHICMLGHQKSLDYLSRLALTSLAFSDGGYMSGHLLKIWSTSGSCSPELRAYSHTLLNTLLQCRPHEFLKWGIDVLVNLIVVEESPGLRVIKTLQDASLNRRFLRSLIHKRPALAGFSTFTARKPDDPATVHDRKIHLEVDDLLARFASQEEGVCFLEDINWLPMALQSWRYNAVTGRAYVLSCESFLSQALTTFKSPSSSKTLPIPLDARELCEAPHKAVNLEGLLRLPWSIEVKQSSGVASPNGTNAKTASFRASTTSFPPKRGSPSNSFENKDSKMANFAAFSSLSDYINIDCYLDSSDAHLLGSNPHSSARIVRVRGLVVDKNGAPLTSTFQQNQSSVSAGGHPVAADKCLSSTLQIGVCPVHRMGKVHPETMGEANAPRAGSSAGGKKSVYNDFLDQDFPASLFSEDSQDWSHCQPRERQTYVKELGNGRFEVAVPGEPVVWIFCRQSEMQGRAHAGSHSKGLFSAADSQRSSYSSIVYLSEVHYYLRLDTGLSLFTPLPRHLFRELARSPRGMEALTTGNEYGDSNILVSLIRFLKTEKRRLFPPIKKSLGKDNISIMVLPPKQPAAVAVVEVFQKVFTQLSSILSLRYLCTW